jgi:hypothetical protein
MAMTRYTISSQNKIVEPMSQHRPLAAGVAQQYEQHCVEKEKRVQVQEE